MIACLWIDHDDSIRSCSKGSGDSFSGQLKTSAEPQHKHFELYEPWMLRKYQGPDSI